MDEKKREILERSLNLFSECGLRSVSMDDVSRELSISKKTLYNFFSNKSDLVKQVLYYLDEKSSVFYKEAASKGENAIDVLLRISFCVRKDFKDANPSMQFDLQKYYPELHKEFFEENQKRIYGMLVRNLNRGIKEKLYRKDLNVELIASLYIKKMVDIQSPDFYMSDEFNFEKIFEVMFENHIRGISNPKGIEYFNSQKDKLQSLFEDV